MSPGFELGWTTPAAWARAALAEPLALLSDHAHCELGAAAAAQRWILRRPGDAELVASGAVEAQGMSFDVEANVVFLGEVSWATAVGGE